MTLTAEDSTAITDLINRLGHLTDSGEFDRIPLPTKSPATGGVSAIA